jgi:3-hydroxybutyryl-CoA dehydrogenase
METIGIVGTGTMGCGITQAFLEHGYKVVLNELNDQLLNDGVSTIYKNLDKRLEKGKISLETKKDALANLVHSSEIEALNKCSIIIEAISENMEIKKNLFKKLDEICGSTTILASNTSSLSITGLSNATKRPEKVIGMHFFNPAPILQLVEIIKGLRTSAETLERISNIILTLEKTPVKVEESPGFIVNRLLIPLINEAVCILAEGVAGAAEIDNAMKLGANHPMGPLALADMIGLDVILAIMETLQAEMGDNKYRPHPLLRKMVRGGLLGKKTKIGFYEY